MPSTEKLLIIGWDGATFDVIRPMLASGELPNVARLLAGGAQGALRSTLPPSSAVAWPTFATGRHPKGHEVFAFYQTDGRTYRPRLVTSRSVRAPSLWDWLGQAGLRTGIINVPITYPPRTLNGFMVSGLLTPGPEEAFTYPPELGDQLLAAPRPFPIEAQVMKQLRQCKEPRQALDILLQWTQDFHQGVLRLAREQAWDCLVVVYRASDIVQHFLGVLWHPELASRRAHLFAGVEDGIHQVYRQLDACLGDLLADLPPGSNVLLVSDHGAGPSYGRFYLNNWLVQNGYLVFKPGARLLRRFGARRVALRRILARLGLAGTARRLPPRLLEMPVPVPDKRQVAHLIDWRRTRVYLPYFGSQGVELRLNLAGRERLGPLQPGDEAWTVLQQVASTLENLRTPHGEPLLQDLSITVEQPDDLLQNNGPDLVAIANEKRHYSILHQLTADGQVFAGPPPRSVGQHRLHGIFIAHGAAFAPQVDLQNARLVDVAPTALHLLGLPVPAEMDGQVLVEALAPEWRLRHPLETTTQGLSAWQSGAPADLTPEEAARVEEALRALGYLE